MHTLFPFRNVPSSDGNRTFVYDCVKDLLQQLKDMDAWSWEWSQLDVQVYVLGHNPIYLLDRVCVNLVSLFTRVFVRPFCVRACLVSLVVTV